MSHWFRYLLTNPRWHLLLAIYSLSMIQKKISGFKAKKVFMLELSGKTQIKTSHLSLSETCVQVPFWEERSWSQDKAVLAVKTNFLVNKVELNKEVVINKTEKTWEIFICKKQIPLDQLDIESTYLDIHSDLTFIIEQAISISLCLGWHNETLCNIFYE